MKIKPDSNKHDHKWTDLLKVGLFSILMSAPLISVGVKCAYVALNKNAYQSYSGTTKPQEEYVNTYDMVLNRDYLFQGKQGTKTNDLSESTNYIIASSIIYNATEYHDVKIGFYRNSPSTDTYLYVRNVSDSTLIFDTTIFPSTTFSYKYVSSSGINSTNLDDYFYEIVLTNVDKLDNVFTYAVNDIANNSLFNWTQNTAIYTGVNAMTTNLDIVNPTIAILITYWTLLTIIYVIIDILLTGFIYLTHLIVKSN